MILLNIQLRMTMKTILLITVFLVRTMTNADSFQNDNDEDPMNNDFYDSINNNDD